MAQSIAHACPVVHWEIGGRDGERLQEFYSRLFGWSIDATNREYGLVAADPERGGIGGGIQTVRPEIPPYVTVYVQVDDLAKSLAEAERLGGATVHEPTPIPGVGSFALLRDPEGNMVGLLGPEV